MRTKKNLPKLGYPCWKVEAVADAIQSIAQLDRGHVHYFLASHAPIERIRNIKTSKDINEEQLFDDLFRPGRRDVLAIVHGDPGTGKSHLIHWLKLRCDDELEAPQFHGVIPVLIERRSGSLKDALEQMIRQLPERFAHYLAPVREALEKISNETARQILVGELRLELGQRRRDRGLPNFDRPLRDLQETCASKGFRDWLTREGGAVDQIIKRLVERSEVEERQELPKFTAAEFRLNPKFKRDNVSAVLDLIDEFDEDPERQQQAADLFNEALPSAIKEMTGLGGTRLRGIFDSIRTDLKASGNTLAFFIEDVSVMAEIDEEVINAVEPQTNDALCRMAAVVGITTPGFKKLRDNQKDRATHLFSLSDQAIGDWHASAEGVAEFAARYLNSVRLEEEDVQELALERRKRGDITMSACKECNVRDACHETFDAIEIGSVTVGLFPFSRVAPQRILEGFAADQGVRKNPRGLLTSVLHPVLTDVDSLEAGTFPDPMRIARLGELPYWSGFENTYCGDWTSADRRRLNVLAEGWVEARTADEAAALLAPFLGPFGFPKFTKAAPTGPESPRPKPTGSDSSPKPQRSNVTIKPKPEPHLESPALKDALSKLNAWFQGGRYIDDGPIRSAIARLIRTSIPWVDRPWPPYEVVQNLLTSGDKMRFRFIEIEDMQAKVTGTRFVLPFKRDASTRDLFEALIQFSIAGNDSWDFTHAEVHKRVVSRWLRKNEDRIRRELEPEVGVEPRRAIETATQFLALASVVRSRSKLPRALDDLLAAIMKPSAVPAPTPLSKDFTRLVEDLSQRAPQVLGFLHKELNVPQGRTTNVNFIDPTAVIEAALRFQESLEVRPLPEDYFREYWQTRFAALSGFDAYADLGRVLDGELNALDELVGDLRTRMATAGFDSDRLSERLTSYCEAVVTLASEKRQANFPVPDGGFDALMRENAFRDRARAWATSADQAEHLIQATNPFDVLYFNPTPLVQARDALRVAETHARTVEKALDAALGGGNGGNPTELAAALLQHLGTIAGLGDDPAARTRSAR